MKRLFYFLRRIGAAALPILLGALPHGGHAQSYDLIQGVVSPQSWAFARYADKIEPDLYTGTMVFNLPIYTYTDNDFNIPVSLGYASNGLMPNVQTGPLGLGWFLNAGGVISREVVGVPNEADRWARYEDGSGLFDGFLAWRRERRGEPQMDNVNNIYAVAIFGENKATLYGAPGEMHYELNPDIFHFNFLGYKGSFVFGFDQDVHFFTTNFPEGEILLDRVSFGNSLIHGFTLKTGDGYAYEFNESETLKDDESSSGRNNNWLLTEITAPNGRTVTFEYDSGDKVVSYTPSGMELSGSYEFMQPYLAGYMNSYTLRRQRSLFEIRYLERITIEDNAEIVFDYSDKPKAEKAFDSSDRESELPVLEKLDAIRVNYPTGTSTEEIGRYTMNYHPVNSNGNPVLFLKQVQMSDRGVYSFEYWDRESTFPLLGSFALDHWGYFNNSTTRANFLPRIDFVPQASYEENVLTTMRRPEFEASRRGMLSEIKYPTGGRSTFTYEANVYSQQVERTENSNYYPRLNPTVNANGFTIEEAGGVRIRKIVETDNNGGTSTRDFYYTELDSSGDPNNNYSTGILLKVPRYNTSFVRQDLDQHQYRVHYLELKRTESASPVTLTVDRTHIEYTQVSERRNDGTFIQYDFTNYNDHPDFLVPVWDIRGTAIIVWPANGAAHYLLADPYSNHFNRGRLSTRTLFDDNHRIDYVEEYTYDTEPGEGDWFTTWQMTAERQYVMKYLLQQYRPVSVVRTEYRDGAPWVTTTSYGYNAANQTVLERVTDGQGTTVETHRQFVTDLTGSTGVEARMRSAGVVRYPIHERTKIVTHGFPTPQMVGGTSTGFAEFTGTGAIKFFKPSVARSINLAAPQPSAGSEISMSGLEDEVDYSYDPFGNVVQTEQRGDKYTAYVWGYGGMYLLAKVEGATIAAVRTKIPETAPLSGALSQTQANALRTIPGALVTTYAYQPLVGVTSITDPAGRTVTYEYDAAGRLLRVLDPNGHVVEQYEYHYSSN